LAKRVFEIAKELGVKSKAIVEKCVAEDIPGITNHMSSVSIGLEATIMQWFSGEEASGTTAVETATKVDLKKVRIKKKAAKKVARRVTEDGEQPPEDKAETAVATEVEPPQEAKPAETTATPATTAPPSEAAPPSESLPAVAPTDTPAQQAETPQEVAAPAAKAPAPAPKRTIVRPNVPTRPTVITPAGPQLDVKQPAKLSGPKVVRVEAPDVIAPPRRRGPPDQSSMTSFRGPRGGGGAGATMPMMPGEGGDTRRGGGAGGGGPGGRNKRRAGPGDGGGAGRGRRTGTGAGKPGGEPGRGGSWRQQDLIEREARLSRSGGFLRQRRRDQKIKSQRSSQKTASLAETGGTVKVTAPFTIKDLSAATGVKAADVVKKLFMEGVIANTNSSITVEKAEEIMLEYDIVLEIEEQATAQQQVVQEFEERDTIAEQSRSPVVTILGHVDHGKTSLLDKIRNANVAAGEAGGITQATSAFRVSITVAGEEKTVCFLDTPGHEAFSEMRSRGATVTDIVVLVVAADDGVMPQTKESIAHAKAAGVPVVVALNKIDLPNATDENVQRILGQLSEEGLNPTEWGGTTDVIRTSAETGEGIDTLLETLDLQAQLLELKADFKGTATGAVIESRQIEGRGAVANILIQQGELKVGDNIVAGRAFGRVRDIMNDRGERIKASSPSTPVQISGLDELPDAGDRFYVVKSLKDAQQAAEQRRIEQRERDLATPQITLDSMFAQMQDTSKKELLIVIKADVQGSVEVIKKSVEDISTDEITVRCLFAAVGGVTESDVTLAAASGAVILGFNVIPSNKARKLAEEKGVQVRNYRVIYDIVDDMKAAAEGLLEPEVREEIIGHADVRQVFRISKVGAIAGCYVTDGAIERNALIRVTRDGIVIEQDRVLEQLKRFKDDAKEVKAGQECGTKIVGYDDIKEGDVLECFRKIEVKRTLGAPREKA